MDIQFSVKNKPPYKQNHANKDEKADQEHYKQSCIDETKKNFLSPTEGYLKIEIRYQRARGRMDSANIIGGIADALEKLVYKNDKQLKEIHYYEQTGSEDGYSVRISSLGGARAVA